MTHVSETPYPSRVARRTEPAPPAPPTPPVPPPDKRLRRKVGFFRSFIGFVGEVLITVGLFLLLYIVWQLWWTSFKVSGELNASVSAFEQVNPGPDTYTEERRTDDPPIVPDMPEGEMYGILHVPGWGWERIPIAEGVSPWVLDSGYAGHYPDTQSVGQLGNFGIAAHRRAFGDTFMNIHTLEKDDPLVVETDKAFIVFRKVDDQVVLPSDTWVLDPVPGEPGEEPNKRIMTMTTCHPMYGNTERYIVWSEMEYWVPKESGRPQILEGEPKRKW